MNQRWLLSFFVAIFLCSGCLSKFGGNKVPVNKLINTQNLAELPTELQKEHIDFSEILNKYDGLNVTQRQAILEHFLAQSNISPEQEAQASYMLGRIYEQLIDKSKNDKAKTSEIKQACKEAIALFDKAKSQALLKVRSLIHISELGTIYGDEKIVRQSLNDILNQDNDPNTIAAARYAFAQSYLRANQIDQASNAFKKLRADFPATNYSLGAAYYLGTLNYVQLEKELGGNLSQKSVKLQNYSSQIKAMLAYYFEYLKESSSGRFASDILAKLETLYKANSNFFKTDELTLMANAYFANGHYSAALALWQKAGATKYPFEIAECLIELKQIPNAQTIFLQAVDKYPNDKRCVSLAKCISKKLNKQDAFKLWEKLHKPKICCQDEVLWNLAIRSSLPKTISYYQQILNSYPGSPYASEAQWCIFWQRIKQSKGKSLMLIANWCYAAANKYSHSKLAPRFMFWAGKLSEDASNKEQAAAYYRQTKNLYTTNYYGQRAQARLDYVEKGYKDNYFWLQLANNKVKQWDWPLPLTNMENLKSDDKGTIAELIYLKQYDEVLAQNEKLPAEIMTFIKGKMKQPMEAINIASKDLQEKGLKKVSPVGSDENLLWQFAYPLLYNREIINSCGEAGIDDPKFLHALIREESRYEPYAISSAKAIGLCQLMPATANSTAKSVGIKMINTNQLYDPAFNIRLGSLYLSSLFKTFDDNGLLAIASYNAGANAVKSQLTNKSLSVDPDYFVEGFPYRETRDYIRKVFNSYYLYKDIYY